MGRATWPAGLRFVATLCLAAAIIGLRRWPQFIHPDVWVEDGTEVIPSFIESGWLGLLTPVSGYLIIPAKLVSFTALSISFAHYAIVATLIATLVQGATVAIVASAPTLLPARHLCALALVCVPTGTEVFALPLYTIWWTGLLTLLALLWDGAALGLRLGVLAIGASSSPLIVAVAPLFVIRACVQRKRDEAVICCAALALASVQAAVFLREPAGAGGAIESVQNIGRLVSAYFGAPLYIKGWPGALPLGCLMLATLGLGLASVPDEDRLGYGLLGLFLGVAILSASVRVPVTATHPLFAGPRYYFYPTVSLLWMLIWIAVRGRKPAAVMAAAMVVCYIPASLKVFMYSRVVPKLSWSEQVAACVAADDTYGFDIQYGDPAVRWVATLRGADCRRLATAAILDRAWTNR